MRRLGTLAVVALFAVAGCGSNGPGPTPRPPVAGSSTPPASSSPSATPSASPEALIEFTVDGAGPYRLGATLAGLEAAGALDEVTPNGECPGNTTARGTGIWSDIRLSFRSDGKLYLAVNRSPSIPTPSGAWLGTTLTDLKKIYASVTTQDLARGGASAFLVVTLSGRGVLFDLDASKQVIAMIAGEGSYLRSSYKSGTNFC